MAECREAALTLAHAFAADDYARYLVDDCSGVGGGGGGGGVGGGDVHGKVTNAVSAEEEDRWRLHVDILTYTVAAHCMSGLATAVGPECDSVALWYVQTVNTPVFCCTQKRALTNSSTVIRRVPPGKQIDGWWTRLRSGMWRLYFQLSPEGKKRYFQEILPLLHDTKAAVLGDRDHDAWYLVYLGTKPSSQGRGYAARLLQDMMARVSLVPHSSPILAFFLSLPPPLQCLHIQLLVAHPPAQQASKQADTKVWGGIPPGEG
jgi:hypothetical protein